MTAKPIILLDDGDTMNDNELRGLQWRHLVGQFFVPIFGGEPVAWAAANYITIANIFKPENWDTRIQAASGYSSFQWNYWRDWIRGMCQLVKVEAPPEDECIELAIQAETYITCRVKSAFPGTIQAINELHAQGYTLHTASGESSLQLHGYLEAMGVRECFGHLYGADLLNTLKETPVYYERLFADAQIAPADALIVDDSPRALAWAKDLGAMTVLVTSEHAAPDGMLRIGSLAELPELVRKNYQ